MTVTVSSFCQIDTLKTHHKNAIQFDIGPIHYRMIDEGYTQSRLLFAGTNTKINLGYSHDNGKYFFQFQISGSGGKVNSSSGNLPSDFIAIQPSIGYLRNLRPSFGKGAGLYAGIHISSINFALQNEPVVDNVDIFSLHGLYASLQGRLKFGARHTIRLSYLIPMIVYSNRVLWSGGASKFTYSDKEHLLKTITSNGNFQYFKIFSTVQFKTEYLLKLGGVVDFQVTYQFFYSDSFIQTPARIYSNELLMGLKFNF
jgi:hypothetical protein